jgi:hypothetical protein
MLKDSLALMMLKISWVEVAAPSGNKKFGIATTDAVAKSGWAFTKTGAEAKSIYIY